jgi:hypothetical protein
LVNVSKTVAGIWQYGLPALLMLAVPALTPQSCTVEVPVRLTSPATSSHGAGATPGKQSGDALLLLGKAQNERTSPRTNSPGASLTWTAFAPLLRACAVSASGPDAAVPPGFTASNPSRAPPSPSFL